MTERQQREYLADWMIKQGFTTGHGESIEDLLRELSWQILELRHRIAELEKP
jgi:hypothetical protein